jgi:hypothetical protein
LVSGARSTVGGGRQNTASGDESFVGGGEYNAASNRGCAVAGGANNIASAQYAAIGGGGGPDSTYKNLASGRASTVPGGEKNTAAGNYSFAAGYRAKANHYGTFVWGDSSDADFASTAADQFLVRASGGVGLGTNDPDAQLDVAGAVYMENSSVPSAVSGHAGVYASSGELYAIDDAGNTSLLSPHDSETGEWIFYSKNIKTGRTVRVDMERLVRKIEELTGEKFMVEEYEK